MIHLMLADACPNGFPPPGLYHGLTCVVDNPGGTLSVQFTGVTDILQIISNVIQMLLSVVGVIAVIMIIIGGISYTTSSGDPGRTKRAKDIIVNSIIGLVLAIAAYAIVGFVSGVF